MDDVSIGEESARICRVQFAFPLNFFAMNVCCSGVQVASPRAPIASASLSITKNQGRIHDSILVKESRTGSTLVRNLIPRLKSWICAKWAAHDVGTDCRKFHSYYDWILWNGIIKVHRRKACLFQVNNENTFFLNNISHVFPLLSRKRWNVLSNRCLDLSAKVYQTFIS